jgi:hypothetical protein
LIRLEPFFEKEGVDRANIAPFYHKTYLELAEFVKVSGEIILTKGVPDQTVHFIGIPDESGYGAKGQTPFSKTDDEVHGFIRKEFFRLLSNLFLNH